MIALAIFLSVLAGTLLVLSLPVFAIVASGSAILVSLHVWKGGPLSPANVPTLLSGALLIGGLFMLGQIDSAPKATATQPEEVKTELVQKKFGDTGEVGGFHVAVGKATSLKDFYGVDQSAWLVSVRNDSEKTKPFRNAVSIGPSCGAESIVRVIDNERFPQDPANLSKGETKTYYVGIKKQKDASSCKVNVWSGNKQVEFSR